MKNLFVILVMILLVLLCLSCTKEKEIEPTSLCSIRLTSFEDVPTIIIGEMTKNQVSSYLTSDEKIIEIYCSNYKKK